MGTDCPHQASSALLSHTKFKAQPQMFFRIRKQMKTGSPVRMHGQASVEKPAPFSSGGSCPGLNSSSLSAHTPFNSSLLPFAHQQKNSSDLLSLKQSELKQVLPASLPGVVFMPVMPALRRPRQRDCCEFEMNYLDLTYIVKLGYHERLCLKANHQNLLRC